MFVDQVQIRVKGGDGGAGSMSFRREAHVPKGGPDGGNGGKGGDVILKADGGISSLIEYHYKNHYSAERGTHGQGSKRHGSHGDNLVLDVPLGTSVYEIDPETSERLFQVADLLHDGEEVIVAEGGHGGRGNAMFVSSTRRAPSFAELGEPATEHFLELEMKLMADAALVGKPSAGKSSLISFMSAAKPKVADYPFTTLTPNLGVVKQGDQSFVAADIPGLIEGAAAGKGLGHEFLRHIERSAVILHVVDISGGFEQSDPINDYYVIKNELEEYAPELIARPTILVANKIDLPGFEENIKDLKNVAEKEGIPFFAVSAVTGKGMRQFIAATADLVHKTRKLAIESEENKPYEKVWDHKREIRDKDFSIVEIEDGVWKVHGRNIERMVIQTDWENEEAVIYLLSELNKLRFDDKLLAAGVKSGDEIQILGRAFTFTHDSEENF